MADDNLTIEAIGDTVSAKTLEALLTDYAPPTDGTTDEHAGTVGRALVEAGIKLTQNKGVLDSNATKLDNMPDSVWST